MLFRKFFPLLFLCSISLFGSEVPAGFELLKSGSGKLVMGVQSNDAPVRIEYDSEQKGHRASGSFVKYCPPEDADAQRSVLIDTEASFRVGPFWHPIHKAWIYGTENCDYQSIICTTCAEKYPFTAGRLTRDGGDIDVVAEVAGYLIIKTESKLFVLPADKGLDLEKAPRVYWKDKKISPVYLNSATNELWFESISVSDDTNRRAMRYHPERLYKAMNVIDQANKSSKRKSKEQLTKEDLDA